MRKSWNFQWADSRGLFENQMLEQTLEDREGHAVEVSGGMVGMYRRPRRQRSFPRRSEKWFILSIKQMWLSTADSMSTVSQEVHVIPTFLCGDRSWEDHSFLSYFPLRSWLEGRRWQVKVNAFLSYFFILSHPPVIFLGTINGILQKLF